MDHYAADGRNESPAERSDRNWTELLQEFRVLQTGVQLLSGFLLTLPFTPLFDTMDSFQRGLYLAMVVLAAATTSVLLGPIAVHRRLFGSHRKEYLVTVGHRLAHVVLAMAASLVVGTTVLVFDVVLSRPVAFGVGAAMTALVIGTVVVLPALVDRHATRSTEDSPADSGPDSDSGPASA